MELSLPPNINRVMSEITTPFKDIQNMLEKEMQMDENLDNENKRLEQQKFSMNL